MQIRFPSLLLWVLFSKIFKLKMIVTVDGTRWAKDYEYDKKLEVQTVSDPQIENVTN